METTQRISLCSYLYLKLAKTSSFSYYLLWFFFYKLGEQEGGTGSARRWRRAGTGVGKGEVGREMGRRMTMVQIYSCM
jgi:hypothetical protein